MRTSSDGSIRKPSLGLSLARVIEWWAVSIVSFFHCSFIFNIILFSFLKKFRYWNFFWLSFSLIVFHKLMPLLSDLFEDVIWVLTFFELFKFWKRISYHFSAFLSVCLSVCGSVCLSLCQCVCVWICLSFFLSVCLSVCLSGCLSGISDMIAYDNEDSWCAQAVMVQSESPHLGCHWSELLNNEL